MADTERLTRIQNQVFETRNRILEALFQRTGIEGGQRGNYLVRTLPGLKPIDEQTSKGILNEIGLVGTDGLVNIPVLVATQRGLEDKIDRLRVNLDGNPGDSGDAMGLSLWIAPKEDFGELTELGDFYLYPDRRADCVNWWITDDMTKQGAALVKDGEIVGGLGLKMEHRARAKAAGRKANMVYGVDLPEEAILLFKNNGWLRTESEMEPVISFLARRVDLSQEHLSVPERQRFIEALALLKSDAIAINDWLGNEFELVEGVNKYLKLDGDIRIEALRLQDPEHPSLKGTIIRIRDIVLPESNSRAAWANLARPKADSHTGTLKIIIYPDGDFSGKVEVRGVEQGGYNTDKLLTKEKLAAILVKIRVD